MPAPAILSREPARLARCGVQKGSHHAHRRIRNRSVCCRIQEGASAGAGATLTAALRLGDDSRSANYDEELHQVRRALLDAQRAAGAIEDTDLEDYDGERFTGRLFGDGDPPHDYFHQLTTREEAGYLYGLAVGLLLGAAGVRS